MTSPAHLENKVKVLVVGEAGVGKTSFVQAVLGEPLRSAPWTVGCAVDVLQHAYRAGTPQEAAYFVELWDVGGSRSHRNSRRVFYSNLHGVVLVHDLANRKSEQNLRQWVAELGQYLSGASVSAIASPYPLSPTSGGGGGRLGLPSSIFDSEACLTERGIPVLLVGTKLDQVEGGGGARRSGQLAADMKAEEVQLDCREAISAGSTNGVRLARFFDAVIQRHFHDRQRHTPSAPGVDRRRRLIL